MDRLQILLEAERRGMLPPDKAAILAEARRRGMVPGGAPAAKEKLGFWNALKESAQTLGLADEAAAFAANPTEENRRKLLSAGESKFQSVGGFGKGENWEAFKELLGGSLGQLVAPAVAATTASFATTPIGGIAAGYGTATAQYTTQNLLRQAQEQERALAEGRTPEETSALKAAGAGAASAGLDYVQFKTFRKLAEAFPFVRNLVSSEKEVAKEATEQLVRAAQEGTLKTTARGTVEGVAKGVAFEVPQEVAQTALERWQAGLSLTDNEAQEEFKQAAIGAVVLGPVIGGAAGALGARGERAQAEKIIDERIKAQQKAGEKPVTEETVPELPVPLDQQPPKVRAEEAPIEARQEPIKLNPRQIQDEIAKMEADQIRRADMLSDLDLLKERIERIGGDYDTGLQRITETFDSTATRLDIFRNRLEELSKPPEETVSAGVAPIPQTAAAQQTIQIDPALAKGLNLPGAEAAPKDQPFTVQAAPVAPIPQVGTAQQTLGLGEAAAPAPGVPVEPTVTAPGVAPIPQGAAAQQALPTPTPAVPVDPVYQQAVEAVTTSGKTSISSLQEKLNIPYNRAKTLIKQMEVEGVVSRPDKSGKRKVMMGAAPEETRAAEQTTQGVAEQVEREPVGGGVGLPPSGPPAEGPAVEGVEGAGLEPAARVAGDVVGREAALPTALEPTAAEPAAAPAELPPIPELREDATDAEIRAYYEAMEARDAAMGIKPTPVAGKRKKKPKVQDLPELKGVELNDLGSAVGKAVKNLPPLTRNVYDTVRNILDAPTISDNIRSGIYMFLSLPQQVQLFAKELPSLKDLLKIVNARGAAFKARREVLDRNIRRWTRILRENESQIDNFYEIANESTRLQVDFKNLTREDLANPEKVRLRNRFYALDKNLQKIYWEMLKSYSNMADEYLALVSKNVSDSTAKEFRAAMAAKRLKVYLPLYREGNYWLRYQDADNETVVRAFRSQAERNAAQKEAAAAGATGFQEFSRIEETYDPGAVGPFFDKVAKELEGRGVSKAVTNALYNLYLDQIPASSVRQQFRKREGVKGYEADLINVYATVGSRMANQLTNLEFVPDIDKAYNDVLADAKKEAAQSKNLAVSKLIQNLNMQMEYIRDPVNSPLVNALSSFSYYWYIIGNVSTAVINLSQIPMVVYPMLAGKYGAKAGDALTKAKDIYFQGGLDNDADGEPRFPADWTFGVGLPKNSPLAKLYDIAVSQSAIRRSTGYDVVEGRKKTYNKGDYVGLWTKTEQILGWTFQNSERFNREVTLIAAFNLELEKNGGDVNAAAQYAIDLVTDAHGTVLNETSPRVFQTGFGKVAFVFKNFAQTQIYLQYRLMNEALRGENAEVRATAAKQFLGVMGMAFVFAGVQGLPLYGAMSVMAGLFEEFFGDEDNPMDPDERIKDAVGSLAYKGPVSQMLQADIASRTGFNNLLWREDEKRVEEVGPFLYAAEQIFGASYAAAMGFYRAYNDWEDGHTDRALEAATPSVIRNALKSWRFLEEGAKTRDGETLVKDFSAYNLFMQSIGFSPLEFAEKTKAAGEVASQKAQIAERKKAIYNRIYLAYINNDKEGLREALEAKNRFNRSPFVLKSQQVIKPADIRKSIKSRQNRTRNSVYGIYIPPKQRAAYEPFILEQYEEDEGT